MLPQRRLAHARGYLELGMLEAAAAELALIPGPACDGADVLAVRMAVLHEQAKWPELARIAGEFTRREPGESAAWITWAYATRRAVSLAAAEQILLTAEVHHPAEATIHFNLGCYACQRGDLSAARERVARAIDLDGKFAAAAQSDPDLAPLRDTGETFGPAKRRRRKT
ncbi:MAG: hypothetical protein B9S34_07015 [Opitutia bacterium Tous-C1TDCM]|nr:MAG: hypothetical protein B9S34_07015 [Opitutae bacterium Tous-C1TDCM]